MELRAEWEPVGGVMARERLVSVSEPLDRAMQQLEESLQDGDTGVGG